jgi:hypothetical protein
MLLDMNDATTTDPEVEYLKTCSREYQLQVVRERLADERRQARLAKRLGLTAPTAGFGLSGRELAKVLGLKP